ncbi:MAG: hypothetical protein QOF17_918 [Solirubrobacteraceae bacterium]|nr:hypothetical protein [Solirubrobacteraceae bacterium]
MHRRLLPILASLVALAALASLAALAVLPAAASAHDETAPVVVRDGLAFHSDTGVELPDELVTRPVAQADLLDPAPIAVADAAELPETWCGSARTDDDRVNAVNPAAAAVKVIYAYASDQPNRFATVADRLQANVSLLSRFVAGQSGARRTIRFDMGTTCGAGYVDVQTLALPSPLAHYVVSGAPQFRRLIDDVSAALSPVGAPRDYAVYADAMRGTNGVSGTGQFYYGAAAEARDTTYHDRGGLVAAVWGREALPAGPYLEPATMLHEITHNLGAVQGSAPHSTGLVGGTPAGHCFDEQDVMCYRDGGPNDVLTYTCPLRAGDVPETYDCGGDDYFNATPAPGSWLATHWNVYDSAFLGSCAELAAACGASGSGDAWPPANTTPVPPAGWVARWTPALSGSDSETPPVTTGQWRLDSGPVVSTTSASVTADGTHRLATRVADGAGNWSPWRTDTVRIDAVDPKVSLSCRPTASRSAAGAYSCRAAASDGRSGVRRLAYTRDGGPARATAGAFTVPRGTIRATATDGAGRTATATSALGASTLRLRDRRGRAVATPRISVHVIRGATVTRVALPSLHVGAGQWRTRACLGACRAFVATARGGRLAARTVSLPGTRRGRTLRVTVQRRASGAWATVLAGRA